MAKRPFMFIGSSAEGLEYAKAIQRNLDHDVECIVWSQGVFGMSEGTLASLVDLIPRLDFAALVLTPDDLIQSRGERQQAPRDNVLLEAGIFLGSLGVHRTFFVVDRSASVKLPSDLAGITPATYTPPVEGTHESALGAASSSIAEAIAKHGFRQQSSRILLKASWHTGRDGTGPAIKVINRTNEALRPYKAAIFHPSIGRYFYFTPSSSGLQHVGQEREHKWTLICQTARDFAAGNGFPHVDPKAVPNSDRRKQIEEKVAEVEPLEDVRFQLQVEDSEDMLLESQAVGWAFARYLRQEVLNDKADGVDAFHLLTEACQNPTAEISQLA